MQLSTWGRGVGSQLARLGLVINIAGGIDPGQVFQRPITKSTHWLPKRLNHFGEVVFDRRWNRWMVGPIDQPIPF